MRNALGPIGKLFPKSPAEEGPLSVPPDFMYIADAMRLAIPHVRAAGVDLMAAEGAGGGSFGLAISAPAGSAGTASLGSRGAAAGLAIIKQHHHPGRHVHRPRDSLAAAL
jgi:hypothetical protein